MKPSASNVESSSEQEEPLDAVELTQAGLELEPHRVQGERDGGEESIDAISGDATLQPTQANLGLESFSLEDFERGTIQGSSGVAVQPTQVGWGLESHSFQEPPSIEEEEVIEEILQGITRRMNILRNDRRRNNLRESQNFQEQPNVEEGAIQPICNGVVQPMQANLGQEPLNLQEQPSVEGREVHEVQPAQVDLLNVPFFEITSDDSAELAGADEPVHDEEDTGVQLRGIQQQAQDGPPQQETAGRRVRLQVRLCGAEWRSKPKCESIASIEPSDFLCKDAICSSARVTVKEEGDTVGLLSTEGLIACATESDDADGSQQTSQDVFGSSMPALIYTCLFRSLCKLTRMVFTYV